MKQFARLSVVIIMLAVIFGMVYACSQQVLRQSANDPQIQMAEDMAAMLNAGKDLTSMTKKDEDIVNIKASLAPFIIIYNRTGKAVWSDGYLGSTAPEVPYGVLLASNNREYNAVTWQPQKGVRIASVTVAADNYYVLSGRNLREVERREDRVFNLATLGWAAAAIVAAGATVIQSIFASLTFHLKRVVTHRKAKK